MASSPQAQVIGNVLLDLIDNLKADEIRPILDRYNRQQQDIDVKKWYPQQAILDVYKAIADEQVNTAENLVAIGMKVVDHLPFTPEVQSLEKAVAFLDTFTQQTHRNIPDTECLRVVEARPGLIVVVNNTPYPADQVYGALWAFSKRYRPAGASFTVRRIENPNPDDFPGTAFEMTWE